VKRRAMLRPPERERPPSGFPRTAYNSCDDDNMHLICRSSQEEITQTCLPHCKTVNQRQTVQAFPESAPQVFQFQFATSPARHANLLDSHAVD
jgi:hypothetical protein